MGSSTGRSGNDVGDEVSSCIWAGDSFRTRSFSASLGEVTLLLRLECSNLVSRPANLDSSIDTDPWRCDLPLLSTPFVSCFFSGEFARPFATAPSGTGEMPRPEGAPSSVAEISVGLGDRAGVGSWPFCCCGGEKGGKVSVAVSGSCSPFIASQFRGQGDRHAATRRTGRKRTRVCWGVGQGMRKGVPFLSPRRGARG